MAYVTGMADDDVVAQRSGIHRDTVRGLLADHEAYGRVTHNEFAGTGGWALTGRGKVEPRRLTDGSPIPGRDVLSSRRTEPSSR